MEIKNKTFDMLQLKFPQYLDKKVFYGDSNYGAYVLEFKAIDIVIFIEYDRINKCKYILARYKWCYQSDIIGSKRFDFSWEDFIQACKWLDEKRLECIKELL
jgi:hypothetical protein